MPRSLLALSIIPFTLTEAACRPPVVHTHAEYGLNRTSAEWLKSGTVRYIQAAFGSLNRRPQQPIHDKFGLKRPNFVRRHGVRLSVYGAL